MRREQDEYAFLLKCRLSRAGKLLAAPLKELVQSPVVSLLKLLHEDVQLAQEALEIAKHSFCAIFRSLELSATRKACSNGQMPCLRLFKLACVLFIAHFCEWARTGLAEGSTGTTRQSIVGHGECELVSRV